MLTIQKIKDGFAYIKALIGKGEAYQDSIVFEGHGEFCDVYFDSINKEIKQEQVDVFNHFQNNYKNYLNEIEQFINSSLRFLEAKKAGEIRKLTLMFDVLSIPYDNYKYDLILVCGKTYKRFIFFNKEISIRVEFRNGRINSIQRKRDIAIDND